MLPRVVTVAKSSGAVVTLEALKEHLRIEVADTLQDQHILASERAAVAAIERMTQRLLLPRQVVLRLAWLPTGRRPVVLPLGRVAADPAPTVTINGAALEGFEVIGQSPALLVPASDWPSVDAEGYPVEIVYTAGMASVPPDLVAAIKLWVGHMFENREAVSLDAPAEVPMTVQALIAPHRILPA